MMRRAAVLGSPIAHSRSPVLHNAAYAALDLDWTYTAIDVPAGTLAQFKRSLDDSWLGFSLTMPLKVEVLPLLDEISADAARIGAVNTVTIREGRWWGSNTDVPAMVELLAGCRGSATILGAGATARSALHALASLGIRDVTVWARRLEAAQTLVLEAGDLGMHLRAVSGPPDGALLVADALVNTVPDTTAWADVTVPQPPGRLLDAVYDPWPPPLTARWPAAHVRSGFDLLLAQATRQVELWTGSPAPRSTMATALLSTVPETDLDRALH